MAKQIDPRPLDYTLAKAADKSSLSVNVIRKLVLNGTIPALRVGKRWVIPAKALEAWFDKSSGQ